MARTRTFIGLAIGDSIRASAKAMQQTLARCGADERAGAGHDSPPVSDFASVPNVIRLGA